MQELFIASFKDNYLGDNSLALLTCKVRCETTFFFVLTCSPRKYLTALGATHEISQMQKCRVVLVDREALMCITGSRL